MPTIAVRTPGAPHAKPPASTFSRTPCVAFSDSQIARFAISASVRIISRVV